MPLTFDNLVTRVRQRLQDTGSDIYGTTEVEAAVNFAKDDCLNLVRRFTDVYPQSTTSVTFTTNTSTAALPSNFIEPLYVDSIRSGETKSRRHELVDFRKQDQISVNDNLWLTRAADGTWSINRRFTENSLTVTITYVADVSDQSSGGAGFTFGPPEVDQMIVIKAVLELLQSRNKGGRNSNLNFWLQREAKQEAAMMEALQMEGEKDGPRYVSTPEDYNDYENYY